MSHQEGLTAYIAAFVAELSKTGVEDVVISPGSRSTPMALVMAEHPDLRIHIQVDERSASFFALGIAKATSKPVALLCTSGTAAANYYPAVIEATISRVPLIVLTADRPHELRDIGAPQAIDQIHLYGKNVKWFVEMAPPEKTEDMIRYARTVCGRAAATASSNPQGPVHLNFPFREPLIPSTDENMFELPERVGGYVEIETGHFSLSDQTFAAIREDIASYSKGIIVCGQLDNSEFTNEVIALADKLQFPIIADPLSQLRSGNHDHQHIIDAYDAFLRNEDAKESLKPEVIIRFGAMPISKALTIFIKENRTARQFVVDSGAGWREPTMSASEMLYCDEALFCKKIGEAPARPGQSDYLHNWLTVNELAKQHLSSISKVEELSEGKLFQQLTEMLPEGSTLFVGNSMPIRDLDSFFLLNKKNIKVMANRGANGIDGIVSTALGIASVSQPCYLVLGDLTFYHDLNGLLASKLYNIDINILLINNNGGGIFSFLPQAKEPKHFEKLFGTPLDLDFSHVVEMYNGKYDLIKDWDHFSETFDQNRRVGGLKVMEIRTTRDSNMMEHRDLWKSVSREITTLLKGDTK
ncbi:2-succinyl-5-enolpyruvyl-6-hydroxy-3-cyclohexene-1-carboxylic-acid synthase [Mesobacillus subterraneus]|uniref:2-succinyl-5-enolpyruvyl-6-hydroxy-3- cyclohexene-1-carboxylic-acid synthase n=1 Tax=Mesobacillus subterraneus TaxID=285983 RepID=UPI001CFDCA7D|nr:2-succinyl-5-enolpyruvyl-6-hydroxy-3-cyclohexene-1-carboxylic-acid synthase [Mesobacillus subterraneus]WLR55960.1 2-succinyl-5-enolpyruvyl-6-hydroxy-3-cyclohexene-1-carboxylic-acid synthase [Mesobacillus subterraneus]